MKGVILYKSKHGATQQYAQWLADDLQLPAFPESGFFVDHDQPMP